MTLCCDCDIFTHYPSVIQSVHVCVSEYSWGQSSAVRIKEIGRELWTHNSAHSYRTTEQLLCSVTKRNTHASLQCGARACEHVNQAKQHKTKWPPEILQLRLFRGSLESVKVSQTPRILHSDNDEYLQLEFLGGPDASEPQCVVCWLWLCYLLFVSKNLF